MLMYAFMLIAQELSSIVNVLSLAIVYSGLGTLSEAILVPFWARAALPLLAAQAEEFSFANASGRNRRSV